MSAEPKGLEAESKAELMRQLQEKERQLLDKSAELEELRKRAQAKVDTNLD